jgi:putative intracellular protease/amidase
MDNITGLKVAILITDGFELVEMMKPRQALDQAGARTSMVSPKHQRVAHGTSWSGVRSFLWMYLWTVPIRAISTLFRFRAAS